MKATGKGRDTWTKRYAGWTRRRAGTAQCSPALVVLAAVAVFGAVIYVYRQIILTTIAVALLAAVSAAVFAGAAAFTVNTVHWYRKRAKLMAANPDGATALATATGDADATAMGTEADWLADAGSELVFDKDGNLHAKTGHKS